MAHAGEGILGRIANQGRALDRVLDFPVFHPVGLAGGEDKLARCDVHLAAAKVGGVQAFFHAGDDFLWGSCHPPNI